MFFYNESFLKSLMFFFNKTQNVNEWLSTALAGIRLHAGSSILSMLGNTSQWSSLYTARMSHFKIWEVNSGGKKYFKTSEPTYWSLSF